MCVAMLRALHDLYIKTPKLNHGVNCGVNFEIVLSGMDYRSWSVNLVECAADLASDQILIKSDEIT